MNQVILPSSILKVLLMANIFMWLTLWSIFNPVIFMTLCCLSFDKIFRILSPTVFFHLSWHLPFPENNLHIYALVCDALLRHALSLLCLWTKVKPKSNNTLPEYLPSLESFLTKQSSYPKTSTLNWHTWINLGSKRMEFMSMIFYQWLQQLCLIWMNQQKVISLISSVQNLV